MLNAQNSGTMPTKLAKELAVASPCSQAGNQCHQNLTIKAQMQADITILNGMQLQSATQNSAIPIPTGKHTQRGHKNKLCPRPLQASWQL
jgi:hypothetical protein